MLLGERIRLRAMEREDLPMFVRWFNDPEVRRNLLPFAPLSLADEEAWFEQGLEDSDTFRYVIEVLSDEGGTPVGVIGLDHLDWRNRSAEFGIAIGDKSYWDKGYGTDATRTMLHFAFDQLNLHRVQLDVFDFNARAIRVYEKLGFKLEGTLRQAHYGDGTYHDIHVMGILNEEFAPD